MFNLRLCVVRQMIERCIGLLKLRFRCLLGERKLRYSPTKVGRITYACATLHNFLISKRFHIFHDIDENMLQNLINAQIANQMVNSQNENLRLGQIRRNEVLNHLI